MKKISKVLVGVALAGASAAAMAQSIDVKVIGKIVPGACTPTLAGGGVLDYGNIKSSTLNQAATTILPQKSTDFTITCDAATKVALKAGDNRASSRIAGLLGAGYDSRSFGLGQVDGKNIGSYWMVIDSGVADGASKSAIVSTDGGKSWAADRTAWMYNTGSGIATWATANTTTPIAFKSLTGKLRVGPTLTKGSDLPLTKEIPLDGSATLELVYL